MKQKEYRKKKFISSDMFRNAFTLLSANSLSQLIGILIYPILTRLYSPDEFGVFNLFLSIGGILIICANAEYHNPIVLPKTKEQAIACFHLGIISTIGICILIFLCSFFSKPITNFFHINSFDEYIIYLPFYVFLSALWNMLNFWYTRNKQFKKIAIYQIFQSSNNAITKSGFGLNKFQTNGLVIGTIIGQASAIIISIINSFQSLKPLFRFNWNECKKSGKKFINFPKYSLPRSLVNFLSGNLPTLLLAPFFPINQIGYFGMALALAFRPINMISSSLFQVFYQKSTEKYLKQETIMPFFKRFTKQCLLFIIPVFSILFMILPQLISFLLGSEWKETGDFIRMMLPWLTISALVAPICYFSDIFSKQRTGLLFEIISLISRFGSLCCGIFFQDFHLAIILYCITNALVIFAQYIWYWWLIYRYEQTIQ